jgi:ClpA/ClpB-like protein
VQQHGLELVEHPAAGPLVHRRQQVVAEPQFSSVGRQETPEVEVRAMNTSAATRLVAAATASQDPEVGLAAVAALRGLVEVVEALQVHNARAKGWSWQRIAAKLGVTKQADHLGRRYLGPEHLVLGVLREGGNGAARVLRAFGVELPAAFGRTALGWAIREATRARRQGVGRVPRTPLRDPPLLVDRALFHAGEQARALGLAAIGPELLLVGVVTDVQTPWPRCMDNRWRRALYASVGLPKGYRGAAGPLLAAFGIDLQQLHAALLAELRAGVP